MNQPLQVPDGPLPPYPAVSEFLNPRWFVGFIRAFVGSWFVTRNFRAFLLGIPTIMFLCAGGLATSRLAEDPGDNLAAAYERAAVNAGRLGADEEADLMWERLMQLRSEDKRYQFILATRLVEQEKYDEARRHLDVLTAEEGYTPARLWLVQHARGESPVFKLTTEQQIDQLQAAVAESPQDAEAHRLLATLHVERNDLRVAEKHLQQAVQQHAILGLPLFELQMRLGRDNREEALSYLRKAARALERRVVTDPDEVQNRIYWAQALIYLGEASEAEAILIESLQTHDSKKLRQAAAALMIGQARQMLSKSSLNAGPASSYLKRAVEIHPQHPQLGAMVVALGGRGGRFSSADLAPLLAHLKSLLENNEENAGNRVTLAQLHTMLSEYDQAAELLESDQTGNTGAQSLLVRVYREQGRHDEAELLTKSLLKTLTATVEKRPADNEAVAGLLDGYLVARQYKKAIALTDRYMASEGLSARELPEVIKRRYVASCVVVYGENVSTDVLEAISFLRKAVDSGHYTPELIQLIVQRSLKDDEAAELAQSLLTKMLADGTSNVQIYSALGTTALALNRLEDAVRSLRLALDQSPGNPILSNNLSLALIRSSDNNFAEAMTLCAAALERMPQHPDVLTTRAEIWLVRKRWKDARVDLEKALPQRPKSAKLREMLIETYKGMGEESLMEEHERVLAEINGPGATADDGSTPR